MIRGLLWLSIASGLAAPPVCAVTMEPTPAPEGCATCALLTATCRDESAIRSGARRVCYGCPEAPDAWVDRPMNSPDSCPSGAGATRWIGSHGRRHDRR